LASHSAHAGNHDDGAFSAFVLALGVHLALVALIALGLRFESRHEISGPIVNAQLIENLPERAAPREPERIEPPVAKKPPPKPVEKDQRAERESARKAAQLEAQRVAKDKARREAAERDLRRSMDIEERLRAESELRERMKTEAESMARARESGAKVLSQSEIARYEALIRQKVERNWHRPPQSADGLSCIIRLRIAPGGDVLSAVIAVSSGDASFDRSVEAAVKRATPLPVPPEAALFEHFRDLELKFKPEG
jgi:colicin import membrane protein